MSTFEKPNRVIVYAVYDNTDHSEGRGREFVRAYTKLESTARRLAKGTYVQGSDAPVEQTFLYQYGYYYFPLGTNVRVVEPNAEDVILEERAKTFFGVIEKAVSLGLSVEDIEILKKGN